MPSNSAFAIQFRFFCLTCAADLLEQMSNFAQGCSGQRGTLIWGRLRSRKLVGSGQYSKRFFVLSALLLEVQCYASYMLCRSLCNEDARHAVKIGLQGQRRKPRRGN